MYRTTENCRNNARVSLVRWRRMRHCALRYSAAAYTQPFKENRLPKKVEQQTTSALFTRRATLRPHLSCSETPAICILHLPSPRRARLRQPRVLHFSSTSYLYQATRRFK